MLLLQVSQYTRSTKVVAALGELRCTGSVEADWAGREGGREGGGGEVNEVDVVPVDKGVGVVEGWM